MLRDFRESWKARGACVNAPTSLFYPDIAKGTSKKDRARLTADAKAYCAECPVAKRCLEYALEYRQFGIWGGYDDVDRETLNKQRQAERRRAREQVRQRARSN